MVSLEFVEDRREASDPLLLTKAIYIILQEQLLVWVDVVRMDSDRPPQESACRFLLGPDATTKYAKEIISRLWGIRLADQRLLPANTGEPIFHYLFGRNGERHAMPDSSSSMHLKLQVVPLYSRLSLFPWEMFMTEIS